MKESDDKQPISGNHSAWMMFTGVASAVVATGRGAAGKTPFVAAVALNKEGHPIKMRDDGGRWFQNQVRC